MKHILLICLLFCVTMTQAADFTTAVSGNLWNAGATWGNAGSTPGVDYPSTGDNATIANGHTVYINGAENCAALTINSTGSTAELAFFAGSLTATSVELISSGGESKIDEISGGTITVNTNSLIFNQSSAGLCSVYLPLGSVAVAGDITVANTATANTVIDMSGGSASFNFGGNFAGGDFITITGGTAGSTFTYNGSAAQTTGTSNAAIVFDNLAMANSHPSGVMLDGALSAANLSGTLTLASGVFNDGGFSIEYAGDISNPGTFINSGTINLTGGLINAGTFNASGTINLTADFTNSGTFTSSGCNINLAGDWDNTVGTYTYFDGDIVTFDGGLFLNQEISGTTSWFNLTVAKGAFASTLSITSGTQNIHNILDINSGAVSNTGASVVLISDAVRTAQMDDIGTGSYSGDMTVQRRIAKTQQSFLSVGSPVSGTTLASWQDDNILYTGTGPGTFTGANYENFGWHNTYWYNEAAADGTMNNGLTKAATTAQAVGASNDFRAFHIYTDAVTYNLDVTGVPNTGTVNIPLQYDGAFAGNQAGWNLIANPYPCTIDWESIHGGTLGTLIDGFFVYNDGLSNYDYYDGDANTGLVAATQFIPHTQGFWVRSTGLTSLEISESDKSTTDQAFYKSSNGSYMRIALSGDVNTFGDGAIILERDDYTENYDADVDIQKFLTLDPDNAPSLYTITPDGYDVCFNKIPSENISIPLVAAAGNLAQGTYTLDFDVPADFMLGACITLEDLHTGVITDLRSDTTYAYVSSDTTTLPRFILHMVKGFNTTVVDVTCFGSAEGAVTIDGAGITGSTFELLDGAGNAVFSGIAANDTVEFSNVPAGEYEVATNHAGSCSIATLTVAEITLSVLSTTTNPVCGANDGSIIATVSGGAGPYMFSNDGGTTFTTGTSPYTFSSLGAGPFSIVIEDANTCQVAESVTLSSATPPVETSTSIDLSCNNANDGSITITAAGTAPFNFSVDGGVNYTAGTSPYTSNGLSTGTYEVMVEDINGCVSVINSITISEPTNLSHAATITDASCAANNGSIVLTGTGGSTPYQFSTDGGATFQSTGSFTGLSAGSYDVIIEDANGCQGADIFAVTNTGGFTPTISSNQTVCYGNSATITSGGAGSGGTYNWDGGLGTGATQLTSPASTTTYTVTMIDGSGCTETASVTITVETEPTVIITPSNTVICDGESVTLTGSGAQAYNWNTGAISSSITVSPTNQTTYTVIGQNGVCQGAAVSSAITVNLAPVVIAGSDQTLIVAGETINFSNTGSDATSYYWSFDDGESSTLGSPSHTYTTAGTYTVILTGTLGNCSSSDTITINIGFTGLEEVNLEESVNLYPNPSNGEFNLSFNFAIKQDVEIRIFNTIGELLESRTMKNTSSSIVEFDLNNNAEGFYFVNIKTNNESITKRISIIK